MRPGVALRQHGGMTHPSSPVRVREARYPQDFAPIAAVLTAADPEWGRSAETLRHDHETRDPALFFAGRVAELGGEVVGVLETGHYDFAFEEWRYWASLRVHPEARGRGVGSALYAEMMGLLEARQAREVRTMLGETDAPGLRFLKGRGWREGWRRHEFRLDTFAADLGPVPDLGSLRLESLTALAGDPLLGERLYELDWTLFQDVPLSQAPTKRSLSAWLASELHDPSTRPDLSFALLDDAQDDPLHGPYLGYTTLIERPVGFFVIGMTGVKRGYQGRGLGRALKLASMRALQTQGGGEIRTQNDPPNLAMISMNRSLGFVQRPDRVRYDLRLEWA